VKTAGWDIEARYNTEVFGNPLQLALYSSRLTEQYTQPAGGAIDRTLGGNNDPKLRVNLSASYEWENLRFFIQERYIGKKFVDARRVEGVLVDDNTVDPAFYTDMTVTYGFEAFGSANEVFLSINNLTNQEPPKDVGAPSSFIQPGNRTTYDWLGRYFNIGLRFRY
jgi:hypothetical protein